MTAVKSTASLYVSWSDQIKDVRNGLRMVGLFLVNTSL